MLAAIPAPPLDAIHVGPLRLTLYGMFIATGVLVAMTMTRRRYAAKGGDPELADRIALPTVIIGFIGARLAYVLPRLDRFADDPLSVFAVWEGGLALFGGLTAGILSVLWLIRRWDGDLPAFADAAAPAVPVAQAIGRWGNYFNQELYGTPTDLPWALYVEPDRRVAAYQAFETFHPTFLYESLWNLALAGFLLWLDRRGRLPRGSLWLVYLIGYAVARFLLELIRTDTTYRLLGLSRNAWVSLAVLIAGLVGLWWWTRRARRRDLETGDAPPAEEPLDQSAGVDAESL
jgi:phosphatidylglycerol---prolipoprotein diacylglyceryl transferase